MRLLCSLLLVVVVVQVCIVRGIGTAYILSFVSVNLGTRLRLHCPVHEGAEPAVKWTYYTPEVGLQVLKRENGTKCDTGPTCDVKKAGYANAGRYTCYKGRAKERRSVTVHMRQEKKKGDAGPYADIDLDMFRESLGIRVKVFKVKVYYKPQDSLLQAGAAVAALLIVLVIVGGLIMDGRRTPKQTEGGESEEVSEKKPIEEGFVGTLEKTLPSKDRSYVTWGLHQAGTQEGDPHYNTVLDLQKVALE